MSLAIWRHPRPMKVAGRCIGRTEVAVDRRKAKRLAHRVRTWARREGCARVVVTSSLARSCCVGRWLRRWGWTHRIDPRLNELDFGAWDGRLWSEIDAAALGAWCNDFAAHAPGGGEPVAELLARCADFLGAAAFGTGAGVGAVVEAVDATEADASRCPPGPLRAHRPNALCVIGHAGWISAARWLQQAGGLPLEAAGWPRAVGYGERVVLTAPAQ